MNTTNKESHQLELFELTSQEKAERIFQKCGTRIELRNEISNSENLREVRSELLKIFQTDPRVKNLSEGL